MKSYQGKLLVLFLALSISPLWAAKARAPLPPIEIQVEVMEVDNVKASQLGINWLDMIRIVEEAPRAVFSLGEIIRPTPLQADLKFLVQEGAAELLAKPNLITDSGTPARFHAGGQIPYIVTTSLGSSHVEFKPYGVVLSVKPKILGNGNIQIKLAASVSAPDTTNGVISQGNAIPALLQREVETNLTLAPDMTASLAGLVQKTENSIEKGVPFLRRIPFLGRLFRWSTKNYRRTTIVMFVTPRLVTY